MLLPMMGRVVCAKQPIGSEFSFTRHQRVPPKIRWRDSTSLSLAAIESVLGLFTVYPSVHTASLIVAATGDGLA
jgi:hypothetical protein